MSTRATITVSDDNDSFDIYQHNDGYPEGHHGLVRHVALAQCLAWDLPRFEAADFAAAIIAILKDRGGSTYLTKDAEAHSDRSFHYRLEPLRDGVATRVQLTITRPSWRETEPDREVFKGSLREAVTKFDAVGETAKQPREDQILMDAEGALCRAQDEINALCGGRPNLDTEQVHEDIVDATRSLMRLRQHFEAMSLWKGLELAADKSIESKLALQAHQRFQRDPGYLDLSLCEEYLRSC